MLLEVARFLTKQSISVMGETIPGLETNANYKIASKIS